MAEDSGTRSGMLWEVKRLLNEMTELPQILLMENVPQVCGTKNVNEFRKWIEFLESKGYTSEYRILNATQYGVPQNRERCFMVSWLGDHYYEFPETRPLQSSLADVLEDNVDDSYYLSEAQISCFMAHSKECEEKGNGFRFTPADTHTHTPRGRLQRERGAEWMTTSLLIKAGNCNPKGEGQSGDVYDSRGVAPTLTCVHDACAKVIE